MWDGPQGFEFVYNPAQGTLDLIGSGPNYLRGNLAADGNWHHIIAIANGISKYPTHLILSISLFVSLQV